MTLTDEAKRLGFTVYESPFVHPKTAFLVAADGALIFIDARPPPTRWERFVSRVRAFLGGYEP